MRTMIDIEATDPRERLTGPLRAAGYTSLGHFITSLSSETADNEARPDSVSDTRHLPSADRH